MEIAVVQLLDGDIRTREVLGWRGLHAIHTHLSSCSQKLRIFLNLKGIKWESHLVDLMAGENFRPWFLGINPRGLVPVLVHDGAVHIESNDIIQYVKVDFLNPGSFQPAMRMRSTASSTTNTISILICEP
jgi:glutathione S-transferase